MKSRTRRIWRNDAGNQRSEPLRQFWPVSLEDLIQIVQTARRDGLQVRAVGSSHSWSDVCLTTGYLVRTPKLNNPLPLENALFREGTDASSMFRIEAGMRLRELNRRLWNRGLALPNMGGYDAQTLVGAAATSTHGAGIEFGPLSECLLSIDLVADDGAVYRIERSDGITNPAAYSRQYPDRTLIQDDDWFGAVAVGMGCMGLIYSAVLRVMPRYFLKEARTLTTWEEVKADLVQGDVIRNNRHYEIMLNPYHVKGVRRCLVTTRNPVESLRGLNIRELRRRFMTEFLASLPYIDRALNLIFHKVPKFAPRMLNMAMRGLVDENYSQRSYRVFNIGVVNQVPALSSEIAFPMADNLYIGGIEQIIRIAERHADRGRVFHTSPIALRFVKGTDHLLSPQYGRDTCMVEIIMLKGTRGALEVMYEYEAASYRLSGRPHWGQVNYLTGSHHLVRAMYPKYDKWIDIYSRLNKHGTFDSPFSKRVGFARHAFEPSDGLEPEPGTSAPETTGTEIPAPERHNPM